jgi:hypothetical protein
MYKYPKKRRTSIAMTPSITTITVTIIAVFEIPDLPPELERATVALVVLVEVMFVAV